MRNKRFTFSTVEISQMLCDKLVSEGGIEPGMYQVLLGASKDDDDEMVVWVELSNLSQPTPSKQEKM